MSTFIDRLKKVSKEEKNIFAERLSTRALSNVHITQGVSVFVLVCFIIYQGIFIYLDGQIDLRLMYVIPVIIIISLGPISNFLYKKGYTNFLADDLLIFVHALMYLLAFWLDCFTDPSLCQIYTPLIIAVGPVLFLRSIKTELLINTLALLLYLFAAYLGITPISAEHAVIQAFIAYLLSIFLLLVIVNIRFVLAKISFDLNNEKQAREKFEYAAEVAEALSYDFLNVYTLDLNKETWKIIKRNGYQIGGDIKPINGDEYSYDEMIKTYIKERIAPKDKERLKKILSLDYVRKQLETSDAYIDSYRAIDNGTEHYYQFRFVKVPSTSKVIVGFRSIDNTMRYEKEQRIALKEALSASRLASDAKTTFINNISHDIRTPLNAIMGFSKHARNHIDDKEVVLGSLKHIDTSGEQVNSYIDKILQFTQLNSNDDEYQRQSYSLNDLANEIINKANNLAKDKNISIVYDNSGIIDDKVKTNKERFEMVIYSVLENAVIYTPNNGHVSLSIRQGSALGNNKIRYVFTVKDDGVGMSNEFLQHIFDPFAREKDTTHSGQSRTGLGLTIAKNILESTGGGIIVNSKVNEGTEVIMIAMLEADNKKKEESKEIIKEDVYHFSNNKAFKDTRVLIVDDNAINLEVAKSLLSEKGFICDIANSGAEAIIKFKDSKPSYYTCILMDILMPDMDGYETTSSIRNLNKLDAKDVIIIALSANGNNIDVDKAYAIGMNDFLSKPFDVDKFINCLNTHLL